MIYYPASVTNGKSLFTEKEILENKINKRINDQYNPALYY